MLPDQRKLDWSIPNNCIDCNKLMRPGHKPADGKTVRHNSNGRCAGCYDREYRISKGWTPKEPTLYNEYEQRCRGCKIYKPYSSFSKTNKGSITGYATYCNFCHRIRSNYRLTYQEYMNKLDEQGNKCFLCKSDGNIGRGLFMDHSHRTGRNRKFLCTNCNGTLGHFKDDIKVLHSAMDYLSSKTHQQHLPKQTDGSLLWKNYKITQEDYDKMSRGQNGTCAICKKESSSYRGTDRLCVDHDHSCCSGKYSCGDCVRGLLCSPCNIGLGMAKEDTATLQRCIEYLSEHEALEPDESIH